jgi:Fasciclin domain
MSTKCGRSNATSKSCPVVYSGLVENQDTLIVRGFLQENYPLFYAILNMNDEVWKALDGSGDRDDDKRQIGFTLFAPNDAAMQALGDKKQSQLMDPRNLETTQKIVGYHVVSERVTSEQLYNSGGVFTIAGEVPVERSVSGGMLGIGGQEDGGVTINKAKIIQSLPVGSGILHEVDHLVSPNILWRYMDQLRIPGSR